MHTPSTIASDTILADQRAKLALEITDQLHRSGFTAYLAGGCVRDALLGKRPKDYDVATDARPEQIESAFGRRRTLAVGRSFGVMCVLPRERGSHEPVEVATFRCDGNYTDGRRPDRVHFSSPEEDAQRRDFTINGLFFDPQRGEVYDFVDGLDDLHARSIRAIGDAEARFEEDKLRLLRAIRFATTYDFQIEAVTLSAIQKHANDVTVCSGERIGAEMRRLLSSDHADRGLNLLMECGLALPIMPLLHDRFVEPSCLQQTMRLLTHFDSHAFPSRLAALAIAAGDDAISVLSDLGTRWRLANEESDAATTAVRLLPTLMQANELRWSQLQPMLVERYSKSALELLIAFSAREQRGEASVERVTKSLELPVDQLNPEPLVSGKDLIDRGMRPGPSFREILASIRADQLDGIVTTSEDVFAQIEKYESN